MSLLAPLFLAGLAAISLPILFHLTRRTPRGRIAFSSLMFLMPSPPRLTRRNRLDNLLLLLLRAIALGLLALAFARPFLREALRTDFDQDRGWRTVILVDTSASMRRGDLWRQATAKVEEALTDLYPADQISLLLFDESVRPAVTFEQWRATPMAGRAELVRRRLAEAKPGWSATHLGSALVTGLEALEASEADRDARSDLEPGRILLVSDLQIGSRLEPLDSFDWPEGVSLTVATIEPQLLTNAGIQLVLETSEGNGNALAKGRRTDFRPRVRISNSQDAAHSQFQVRWASAEPKERNPVSETDSDSVTEPGVTEPGAIEPGVTEPGAIEPGAIEPGAIEPGVTEPGVIDVYVPPGQSRVVRVPVAPAASPRDRLLLEGDDHDFDNVVYLVPPRIEQVTVLYLGDDEPADPKQPRYYLERALSVHSRRAVRIVAPQPDEPLWPENDQHPPLTVVTIPLLANRIATLRQSLEAGGTVLFVLKTVPAAQTLAGLTGARSVSVEEAMAGDYTMLGEIDYRHPLFVQFADPRFGDFTKIHFWRHRRLELRPWPDAKVLARFDDGDPALVEIPVGTGTLLVLTAGWHPEDSQLALSSKFVPLLCAVLDRSLGDIGRVVYHRVGDTVELPVSRTNATLFVRRPDGGETPLVGNDPSTGFGAGSSVPNPRQSVARSAFSQTASPGVYTVVSRRRTQSPESQPVPKDGTLTTREPGFSEETGAFAQETALSFAVNLAPAESKTVALPREELERLGVRLTGREPELTEEERTLRLRQMQSVELEDRQKFWRWLIVAALAVLLLETLLAGRLSRVSTADDRGDAAADRNETI